MASAYAAFTSLMHLIAQLHEHPYPPIQLDEKQVDTLNSKICFFQRFLEDHHSTIDHDLEIRIADSAHAAEDLIETHVADRVPDFYGSLQRVIEGMHSIKKQVTTELNLNEPSHQRNNRPAPYAMPHASSSQSPSTTFGENIVVGIEDIIINIVDMLTSSQQKSGRRVISISGMGGIGKTTLARELYNNTYIKKHFDFFAWATISKDYNTHESLVEILHCLDRSESKESLREMSEYELGQQLYQYLIGRRYLVVLDDVWDLEAWDSLRSFFPTNSGSGIVITTRESKFASMSTFSFRMDLLDEHNSWDLFCKHAFRQDRCPCELENVGKKIANKCGGLPLSIVVIGSHLSKSSEPEYWENIAQNLSSVLNSEGDDDCLKIVSLSYTYLPVHLKPCFLYMSVFPEDEEIDASILIKLWMAEGFVKPINGKSLKDAAKDYLNDLIGRNLIIAHESSLRGRIKSCKIHDLLRDFCLKEGSNKKNFLCTVHKLDDLRVTNNKEQRRIVVPLSALTGASTADCEEELLDNIGTQNKEISGLNEPLVDDHHLDISIFLKARKLLRSLIITGRPPSLENKLLRVLDSFDISHTMIPEVLRRLVNLRYFCLSSISDLDDIYDLPSSIFLHWNLQYLIIINANYIKAPPEIWKMPQLRHIKIVTGLVLPHPPSEESDDVIIMENLQSAGEIINFRLCEEVVKRIPNIKKLWVEYRDDYEGFDEGLCTLNNVDRLQKLESFTCHITSKRNVDQSHQMLRNITFPNSLKKLIVSNLHWDDVTTKIGSLPLLEVLKLYECKGHEWELVEGQFAELKFLALYDCRSLRYLKANNYHFPCLQRLFMRGMNSLEGISSDIGDIPMLKSVELFFCPDEAVISAKEIADEQYDNENDELQVTAEMFRRNSSLSEESLTSTCNFQIELH